MTCAHFVCHSCPDESAQLREELRLAHAFHDIAAKERDLERVRCNRVEQERDAARAEVEMLRGVGCGELREGAEVADGPCGACLKCARRERDEARAEVERLKAAINAK